MALILIVDDSPTEVFVMQKALEKHGFKTAAAENGEEGVRKAKAMKPDLIFMDIVMPGVNGYQATRMLVNDPETSLIPIIMVTTKGQETDRVWGKASSSNPTTWLGISKATCIQAIPALGGSRKWLRLRRSDQRLVNHSIHIARRVGDDLIRLVVRLREERRAHGRRHTDLRLASAFST